MKRVVLVLILFFAAGVLAACGDDPVDEVTPPSFERLEINGQAPFAEGTHVPAVVEKQDPIRLDVYFDNPSDLDINLLRIHDRTIRASRFEDESTNEHVVFYITAGAIPGETRYSFDEFEYMHDGVQAVEVTENNTYDILVLEALPAAEIVSVDPGVDSLAFDLGLTDTDDTILDGRIELLHEDDIVAERELIAGDHVFAGLFSDQEYTIRILVDYERNDGEGLQEDYVLLESAPVSTLPKSPPTASIEEPVIGETDIRFSLTYADPHGVLMEEGLRALIIKDEIVEMEIPLDEEELADIHIENLLNNNTYTLKIVADYDLHDLEGPRVDQILAEKTFTTLQMDLPPITVDIDAPAENRVSFAIDTSALKDIVLPSTMHARLYNEADEQKWAQTLLIRDDMVYDVDGLFADNTYRLIITAKYDLGDGEGVREGVIFEDTVTTPANEKPTGDVTNVELDAASVTFTATVNDPDDTILEGRLIARLYALPVGEDFDPDDLDPYRVKVIDSGGTYTFEDVPIDHEKTYAVEIITDYDLRDKSGPVRGHALGSHYIRATKTPKPGEASIADVERILGGFIIDIDVQDPHDSFRDGEVTVSLYEGETLVHTETLSESRTVTIDTLAADTEYRIYLTATIDFDDGGEPYETVFVRETLRTVSGWPGIDFSDMNIEKESMATDVQIDDAHGSIVAGSLRLVLYDAEDEPIGTRKIEDGMHMRFLTLYSDYTYMLRVYGDIDLADGEGVREDELLHEETFTTEPYEFPIPEFSELAITEEEIRLTITDIDDSDGIYVENDMRLVLYEITDEGDVLLEEIHLDLTSPDGIGGEYVFTAQHEEEKNYRISIEASYDLNDARGLQEDEVLRSMSFSTIYDPKED